MTGILTEIIILFTILFIVVWIISEVIIAKDIKNSEDNESIWLVVNVLLPIIGCVIYKLTHRTKKVY